jgi:flavin reductase (DIM6/NTAB) family NADH-FMN oxidoreductase RutF
MPTTLVGTMVNGKINYAAIAWVGIMESDMITIAVNKGHYSNNGIKEHKTFSVNIPSVRLARETDYCGLVSGKNVDKSGVFRSFFGELKTVPLIEECPVGMACKLADTFDFPQHDVFVGEIHEIFCDDSCLTNGKPDFAKIDPLLFILSGRGYWKLGERVADAFKVGKELRKTSE